MRFLPTLGLFAVTAVAEIVGCYLPYLWLRRSGSAWLLLPAALSLALFAWLLTLHPAAAGRTYAAYGGVYVAVAMAWLWSVDGIRPDRWDLIGSAVAVAGIRSTAMAWALPLTASSVPGSSTGPWLSSTCGRSSGSRCGRAPAWRTMNPAALPAD